MASPKRRKAAGKPLIAVTSGDPGGVGPEMVGHLFSGYRPRRSMPLLVGAPQLFVPWLERFGARAFVVTEFGSLKKRISTSGAVPLILDTGCREKFSTGKDSRGGGAHAGAAVELACRLVRRGLVEGIVTAPLSKHSLRLAGHRFPGHTELFARRLRAPECQMVMVYGKLRVVPVTRHVPIKAVSKHLTRERIETCLSVVNRALRELFAVREPVIAVAALNPHAGERGDLGKEEIEVILPAVRRAARRGIRATGPVSGDALFQTIENGAFDAYLAMYHDQGLIPFKMRAKRRGVNVTIGLPVVRTSVDHGVAYDIAGRGVAGVQSLRAAYLLAETLVRRSRRSKRR